MAGIRIGPGNRAAGGGACAVVAGRAVSARGRAGAGGGFRCNRASRGKHRKRGARSRHVKRKRLPRKPRTEEAGGPAPAPDSLRPHVPGSADLDTPEEPAPAAGPGEPATAGEALPVPSKAAPEASR